MVQKRKIERWCRIVMWMFMKDLHPSRVSEFRWKIWFKRSLIFNTSKYLKQVLLQTFILQCFSLNRHWNLEIWLHVVHYLKVTFQKLKQQSIALAHTNNAMTTAFKWLWVKSQIGFFSKNLLKAHKESPACSNWSVQKHLFRGKVSSDLEIESNGLI